MCGFDNDWRCPNFTRAQADAWMEGHPDGGQMAYCPAGGCSEQNGCAREHQAAVERLTGQPVPLESVHQD